MKNLLTQFSLFVLLFSGFILSGCSGQSETQQNNTAEGAALQYFESIYNTKNFKAALSVSSPKLQRLMKSYHTPRAVARHVINLRYDSEVRLEIDAGNAVGRAEFATEWRVSIFFSGNYQGNTVDELRTVQMKKQDGKWVVDSILADRFS